MSEPLSPSERSMRARLAAHIGHSKLDPKERTRAGRKKFNERFLDQVDPDRALPRAERERRAEHARKAYFTALAFKSARARRHAK